jgi:predicted Ser/Thr protein kinase
MLGAKGSAFLAKPRKGMATVIKLSEQEHFAVVFNNRASFDKIGVALRCLTDEVLLEVIMPDNHRYEHYEIVKRSDGRLWELGQGDVSITYQARDTHLKRPVALKVMNAICLVSETARHRFLSEAQAAAALRHQNVASVFHLSMDHDKYFYVMEFIDGQPIDEYIKKKGTLTPLEALDIALQVAHALAAAAKEGLVHPDLRPANIMLVDEEGEKVVKVTDFELAQRVDRESEHIDIYSLGATLYYLVTGRPPFSDSMGEIISQHLNRPVPTEPLRGYPSSFVSLILSMMEKNPDKRPQSVTELREKIQNCIRELSGTEINTSDPGVISTLSQDDTTPTVVLAPFSTGTLAIGRAFLDKYRVDQTLPGKDNVAGKCYRGVDLERQLEVSLLVLSPEYLADGERLATLERAVNQVRKSPCKGLGQIIALETAGNQIVLVEEFLSAPSLREILRARKMLSPAEVVHALKALAAVADHAREKQLEYVDFTLGGIQLSDSPQAKNTSDIEELIRKPLTEWSELTPLVAPINFTFGCDSPSPWDGTTTVAQSFVSLCRRRDSYIRQLSLLAYRLLGGPGSTLEIQGHYIPLAALSEEGNHVLKRGLIETASEFADALATCLADRFVDDFVCPVPALQHAL